MIKKFLGLAGFLTVLNPIGVHAANTAILDLSDRKVTVLNEDSQTLASFPVAVGKAAYPTPAGTFKINQKVYKPHWRNPFSGEVRYFGFSPLGIGWLGFLDLKGGSIGFHGILPSMKSSIGTSASHGCVRLYNHDMLKLFNLLEIGDTVEVKY